MTKLRILQYPDPKLRRKGIPVKNFNDPQLQKIIDDMFETHYAAINCAALAATQLDIDNAPHITVIDFSPLKNQPLCLVNGKIIAREGSQCEEEGCMSVGGGSGCWDKVTHAYKIHVQAFDRHGKPLDFVAEEFMAKCIQHELDHLDGKLFVDHLSALKRSRIDNRIKKITRLKGA